MKSAHLFAPWKASLQPLEEQWRVALGREAALVLCAVPGQLVCVQNCNSLPDGDISNTKSLAGTHILREAQPKALRRVEGL